MIDTRLLESLVEKAVLAGVSAKVDPVTLVSGIARSVMACLEAGRQSKETVSLEQVRTIAIQNEIPPEALTVALVRCGLFSLDADGLRLTMKGLTAISTLDNPMVKNILGELLREGQK